MDGLASGRSLRDRKPVTYTFGKQRKLMKHALVIDLVAFIIDYSRHLLYFPITISPKVDFPYSAQSSMFTIPGVLFLGTWGMLNRDFI